ncbi:MAG: hypothetical protein CMM58_13060 [Rhodospirillaceae bacterium]|nr:hypothetical protein [Rhodospirillaceae bacterium]
MVRGRTYNFSDTKCDICWVVALRAEAKPLISKFDLEPLSEKSIFPIYENKKIRQVLVISGVGQLNSAAAIAFVAGKCNTAPWTAWINIGIAGSCGGSLGDLLQVIKVTNHRNSKSSFPGFRFSQFVPLAQLETLDAPSASYKADRLYDMEGAAFAEIASRFSSNELTFIFKIISDTTRSELSQIKGVNVEKLVDHNIDIIELLVKDIGELVDDEKKRLEIPKEVYTILNQYHFSVTRSRQLIQSYRRWRAVFPDKSFRDLCTKARTAKDVITILEETLSSTSFGEESQW